MKEFLKTVLASMTGVLLASFVMLVMLFSLIGAIVASMEETPMIEENSVLLLHLDGALEERAADDSFSSIMSDEMAVLGLDEIGRAHV